MIRVTIHQDQKESVTLKLEGKLAGKQISELDRAWQSLAPSLVSKGLVVDIRGLTFADAEGIRALAEIHSKTGAEFLADTPLTKYYAEMAQQGIPTKSLETY
jgi:anti-anti-sigma regulatory factor